MNPFAPKTPQRTPASSAGQSKGVFRSLLFWREASQFSLLLFVAAVAVLVITVSWLTGWIGDWGGFVKARTKKVVPAVVEPVVPAAPTHARLIDGVAIPDTEQASGRYYALTIDNLYVARPQSGISKASVVYEAPVEAGITRFLFVFPDDVQVDKIGPVRSARPYFLDWISEYDALYAHVGGSNEALDNITAYGLRDMNEFSQGAYFWRASEREAPHNAYTSTEMLSKNFEKRFSERPPRPLDGWKFKADAPEGERPAKATLAIEYGDPHVNVSWNYAPATNSYARIQGGKAIKDADGTAVTAKNIVVQEAAVTVIDDYGRRKIVTVGKGEATFAFDGLTVHGTWSKDSRTARTRFFDASRNEIAFNAGTTWIEVVPTGTAVTAE